MENEDGYMSLNLKDRLKSREGLKGKKIGFHLLFSYADIYLQLEKICVLERQSERERNR